MKFEPRSRYRRALRPLLDAALRTRNLRDWSGGFLTVARLSLDDREREGEIEALEDYLLAHSGLPEGELDQDLLAAFADEIDRVCHDETLSLRLSYNAVSWLLSAWRFLADARLEDSDPLVVLPCCAAIGTGVHAVAFRGVAEGTRVLMHMASGPLWRVRDAVAQGFQRMLAEDWSRAMYELRRYALIGDAQQQQVMVGAVAEPGLLTERAHALDALDLLHTVLAGFRRLPAHVRYSPSVQALQRTLVEAISTVIAVERRAGFAAAQTWLAWGDPDVAEIVRESVERQPLASCQEAASLRQSFSNGRK